MENTRESKIISLSKEIENMVMEEYRLRTKIQSLQPRLQANLEAEYGREGREKRLVLSDEQKDKLRKESGISDIEDQLDPILDRNVETGIEKIRSLVNSVYESGEKGRVVATKEKDGRLKGIVRIKPSRLAIDNMLVWVYKNEDVLSPELCRKLVPSTNKGFITIEGLSDRQYSLSDLFNKPIEIKPRGYEKEELDGLFKELRQEYQDSDIIEIFPKDYKSNN